MSDHGARIGDGPADRTLFVSRRRWATIGVCAAAFVAVGVVIGLTDNLWGWVVVVCFGLVLVAAVWQLVSPGRLVLTSSAFTVFTLGRTMHYELARCGVFTVWRVGRVGNQVVVFDYEGSGAGRLARANRRVSGASAALPDTYGMKAEQLAGIMNDARSAALAPKPSR